MGSDLQCKSRYKLRWDGPSPTLCSHLRLGNAGVFLGLADANGMVSLQVMAIPWSLQPMHTARQVYTFNIIANQMLERVFLSYLLENCVQLNLQSTLYAIGIAFSRLNGAKERLQVLPLLSLGLSILMSML